MKGEKFMNDEPYACPLTRGETILVALDGSGSSEFALEQAFSMAKTCNSMLYAITVIDAYPIQIEGSPGVNENVEKEAQKLLEKAAAKAKEENINFETILRWEKNPHTAIIKEAKKRGVDLIIVGSHGKTGLKKLFLGSVAQKVIGYARCPVMVVPDELD
jgi:nucleotide-binding universal stress UspA family protein